MHSRRIACHDPAPESVLCRVPIGVFARVSIVGPVVRGALAPLVHAMHALPESDRAAWLHDLETDAPTVVAVLEQLLQERRRDSDAPAKATSDGA